jgi:protein tyrosine phosphatase (PTP) superfamily phosphohydrolase (DUF442 family)
VKDIYHYQFLSETLSSSGMPTAEQFKEIAEADVQVIINLAPPDVPNALQNEDELAANLGIEYLNIPVIWRAPESEKLIQFMDEMDAHAGEKIHVHCEANYRASAFIMMYRVLRLGWKKEDAVPIMEKMWNPEDFPVWQKFIDENLAEGIQKD